MHHQCHLKTAWRGEKKNQNAGVFVDRVSMERTFYTVCNEENQQKGTAIPSLNDTNMLILLRL